MEKKFNHLNHANLMTIKTIEVQCDQCKILFQKSKSEIKRKPNERHFCCRQCYFDSKKIPIIDCKYCEKPFECGKNRLKIYKEHFCSVKCQKLQWEKNKNIIGRTYGRCKVICIDEESDLIETCYVLECQCKERFSRRLLEIKRGHVYECPNCIFRRSQYYIGGKKYGRLSVQHQWEWRTSETNGKRFRYWFCICECGKELWIAANSILRSHTVSCGCFAQKNNSRYVNETLYPTRDEQSRLSNKTIYTRWLMLIHKCYNSKHSTYKSWGGKGYTVCDVWKNDFTSFKNWVIDNDFHNKKSICIKDEFKEFNPENCYLDSISAQANRMRNKKTLDKFGIEYSGQVKTLRQWCDHRGVSYEKIYKRWVFCKDLEKCFNDKLWNDGSGCHVRRTDIDDDQIRDLYNQGMTQKEITHHLKFHGVYYRMKKMGLLSRPAKRRSSLPSQSEGNTN